MSLHLKKINKSKLVKANKLGYNTRRYYPIAVKSTESDILDHLLDKTRGRIILFLLEHRKSKFKEIMQYIDRAQRTNSFQLQHVEQDGIISVVRVIRNNQFYRLKNRSRVVRIVSKYKSNFK